MIHKNKMDTPNNRLPTISVNQWAPKYILEKAIDKMNGVVTEKGIQRVFFDIKGVIKKAKKLNMTQLNAV